MANARHGILRKFLAIGTPSRQEKPYARQLEV